MDSKEIREAARELDAIRQNAADSVELSDEELDDYAGYIKVINAVSEATEEWIRKHDAAILGAEPAQDFRDDIKECPWCGPDGTARYGDGEKICPECGGDHIYKPAPCRGNECEDFGCEDCDSRKEPAQDNKGERDGS